MKLYLAAPYAARDIVKSTGVLFTHSGHTLTSGWLQATRAITPDALGTAPAHTTQVVMHHAGLDLAEVDACDVLVHFTASFLRMMEPTLDDTTHQLHSGGRHVETGYALALHKSVIVLGEPENIFQRGLCHPAPSLTHALDILDEMSEDWI